MGTLIINPYLNQRFLLDQYPGAAAAYSLRQLISSATNVVRVRRSSDDAESDFTAAEVSDGALESWVGGGNNGFVTIWYDQSGNNKDATQATAGAQPKIVDNGALVTEDGKAALELDGSDILLTTRNYTITSQSSFAVFSMSSSSELAARIVSNGDGDNDYETGPVYIPILRTTTTANVSSYTNDYVANISVNYDEQTLFSSIHSGSSISNRKNSGSLATSANTLSATFIRMSIGNDPQGTASGGFAGFIQEVIVYDSDQSANRVGIETNINDHYEIFN